MCELLNRIWSRPRGEWTRVLRRELPALAAEIVEELLHGIPEFSALIDDNDAIDEEVLRQAVEEALLTTLGYQEHSREQGPDQNEDQNEDPAGSRIETPAGIGLKEAGREECEVMHEGREESMREAVREVARDGTRDGGVREGARGYDRARHELFKALTDDRIASDSSLVELAEAAGWPLPLAVRAIVPATPGEAQQLTAVLDDASSACSPAGPACWSPARSRRSAARWNTCCAAASRPSATPSRSATPPPRCAGRCA